MGLLALQGRFGRHSDFDLGRNWSQNWFFGGVEGPAEEGLSDTSMRVSERVGLGHLLLFFLPKLPNRPLDPDSVVGEGREGRE